MSQKMKIKIENEFSEGDCGRGFYRIENYCVNVSLASSTSAGTDVASKCSAIQAGQLTAVTPALAFLIRVSQTRQLSLDLTGSILSQKGTWEPM
jgi:hypothetical protein